MVTSRSSELVHAQMIETQYQQARNSIFSENVTLLFIVLSSLLHNPWQTVVLWASCEIATQVYRGFFMLRLYAKGWPKANFVRYWAVHHAIYQTSIGLVWGAAMFVFAHPSDPQSVVLTVIGLVVITSGAVPGLAYNQLALRGFLVTAFGLTAVRLMQFGSADYFILAIAIILYGGVLWLMGALQGRNVEEGIRIRYENIDLMAELSAQTQQAEDAREAAEAANLGKSQFLAAASHDLRQPLYALSLFSESLQSLTLSKKARSIVGHMQGNLDALERLFSGLLDISRLDAGVVKAKRAPIALDVLFDRIDHYLRPLSLQLRVDLRYRSDGAVIFSDPALIEQILVNLAINALRNTERGGVLIASRKRGDQVRLEVWDTGTGIAEADLGRIFDEFVQVGNPERNRRKGMGLGLAIVRRAALLLDTSVSVRSQLGRGSRFSLSQPLAASHQTPETAAFSDLDDPIVGLKLLIVEDDPDVRAALELLTRQWGVMADVVADADEALEILGRPVVYDVMLSDYRLPGSLNGLELLRRCREQDIRDMALCLITGDLDPAILADALAAEIPVVHKPLPPPRLRALLIHLASKAGRPGKPRLESTFGVTPSPPGRSATLRTTLSDPL